MSMTAALSGTANKSGLAKQSSVGHNYLDPTKMGFDAAKLNPGDKASAGKVWQHEFVEGGGGGWFEADDPSLNKASLPSAPEAPAAAPAGGGSGAGAPVDTAGLSAAMAGLRSAASPQPPPPMMQSLSAPGDANPNLGQRMPPISMRQLAMMLPRIY